MEGSLPKAATVCSMLWLPMEPQGIVFVFSFPSTGGKLLPFISWSMVPWWEKGEFLLSYSLPDLILSNCCVPKSWDETC